eukprot:6000243-Amphidinium_carterae.1
MISVLMIDAHLHAALYAGTVMRHLSGKKTGARPLSNVSSNRNSKMIYLGKKCKPESSTRTKS